MPVIKSETDVSYFDEEFTSEDARLTPPESGTIHPQLYDRLLIVTRLSKP